MDAFVSLNYETIRPGAAMLRAVTASTLNGKGIFTTLAVHRGRPFLWDKHWSRLNNDASKLGLDLAEHSESRTKRQLSSLLDLNGVQGGRARITFLDESVTSLWKYEATSRVTLLITTAAFRANPVPMRLTTSPYPINSGSPLAGVKSCNYLEKILANHEAKQRGYEEAIQLNERNEITSATLANVFWLKDRKLYTPALRTGCLAGTTRGYVIDNLECEEVVSLSDDLRTADEIFLSSAGIGVIQVEHFDGRELACSSHPIMELMPAR